ncbi:MAG: methyltransferase domain-containing protein, partial [Raoultibacter sp.]
MKTNKPKTKAKIKAKHAARKPQAKGGQSATRKKPAGKPQAGGGRPAQRKQQSSANQSPGQARVQVGAPAAGVAGAATSQPATLCPVERLCGACQLLEVPYEKQLADKQASLISLFDPVANQATVFNAILGMDDPFHYRSKVVSPYAPGKKIPGSGQTARGRDDGRGRQAGKNNGRNNKPRHEILCGMYAAHSHRLVATDTCLIENQVAKSIVLAIRDLMPQFRLEPYREDTGTGFLRHAVVRVGHTSEEVLLTLVTNARQFPGSKNFIRELVRRCPEITTVVQNINTRQTNVILGEAEQVLYGPGFILDNICGLSFRVSSHSFYQVNAVQTEVLYRRAIEMAQLSGTETVLDAYCGTGTIGLVAARGFESSKRPVAAAPAVEISGSGRATEELPACEGAAPGAADPVRGACAAHVIGVDNVASAIRDATNNAKHNGIENAEFVTANASDFMRDLAEKEAQIDVLLMDPPRTGANETFLQAACQLAPQRIVYISCNPQTQLRDVEYLVKHGYTL